MASPSESRVRQVFGASNVLVALILFVGVALLQPRYWLVDVPAVLLAIVELASGVALLARLSWAERALAIAAWITFVGGLFLVGLIVLTMVFLRTIHGDDGLVATLASGLVLALLLPYTVVLPTLQLLWLKRASDESRS